MNELMELLEMQQDLDALIQEAVGDLTVNEFQVLKEAGILDEAAASQVFKAAKSAKKAAFVALDTPGNRAAADRAADALKRAKALVPAGSARTVRKDAIPKYSLGQKLSNLTHKTGKTVGKVAAKHGKQVAAASVGAGVGAAGATQSPINKANAIYKQTGNAVMACKAIFKDAAKVKACAAKLYASKGGASKLQKLRDIAQSAL